jgi:hypothetical protein
MSNPYTFQEYLQVEKEKADWFKAQVQKQSGRPLTPEA